MVNYMYKYLFIIVILVGLILTSCENPYANEEGYWVYSLSIINADGTGFTHLTTEVTKGFFTPDGTKIIGGSSQSLWSIDIDGSNFVILNDSLGNNDELTFRPDGEKIVFSSHDYYNADLYLMNIDGSNIQNLTNTLQIAESKPQFSPDGNFILYIKFDRTDIENQIYSICYRDIEGTFENEIVSFVYGIDGLRYDLALWAGSEKIIYAFIGYPSVSSRGIFSVNIDGTDNTQLFEGYIHSHSFSISQDGSKIVFEFDGDIILLNSDGTGLINLGSGRNPIISPNGEKITFTTSQDLTIMNIDGSDVITLEEFISSDFHEFSWDSEKIVFTDGEVFQGD